MKKLGIKTVKILKILRDASSLINPRFLIYDNECTFVHVENVVVVFEKTYRLLHESLWIFCLNDLNLSCKESFSSIESDGPFQIPDPVPVFRFQYPPPATHILSSEFWLRDSGRPRRSGGSIVDWWECDSKLCIIWILNYIPLHIPSPCCPWRLLRSWDGRRGDWSDLPDGDSDWWPVFAWVDELS